MNKNKDQVKLRIVYLDFDDLKNPLLNAGQARATYEVASRLIKRGHNVTVITSRYPSYKNRVESGIVYKHIGLESKFIRLNNIFYILTLPFSLRKISADVVVECFTPPASVMFSPLFTRVPVVVLPSMFNAKEFAEKYNLPFHLVEKFGMRFYKYIMPYSDVDSAKAKLLNQNIIYKIIPEGVGEEYFKIKHEKPRHILFLGRYDIAQKGIDLLLKAYAKVADQIPYPVVIAGHGPDEEKIKKLVSDLYLENKIKIAGPAYGQKKFKLMSEALYVAFPSRHEGMSLWSLEALAAGLPLICFDLPGSKWMDSNIALKATPFDIEGYGKLLVKAANPQLIRKMSSKCRKFAQQFSWEKVAKEYESFLQEVIARERSIA